MASPRAVQGRVREIQGREMGARDGSLEEEALELAWRMGHTTQQHSIGPQTLLSSLLPGDIPSAASRRLKAQIGEPTFDPPYLKPSLSYVMFGGG